MALDILPDRKFLGVRASRATLVRRWQRYEPVSVFAYLLALQGYEKPASLTARGFAQRLLELAQDDGEWRKLISSYEHVRTKLCERNYTKLPALAVSGAGDLPPPDVSIDPLPPEVQDEVVNYGKAAPGRKGKPSLRK